MTPPTAANPFRPRSVILLLAIVILAAVFRLVDLSNRPMHCDEAVHAIKFGQLLEDNHYVYDPHEYHGPALNYLTLPVAWVARAGKLTDITETHLRLVPAVFGILLVALTGLLRRELGWPTVLIAALLTAVSPAMVFYSRYYIQEMLFVCFTFGAFIAWIRFLHAAQREDGGQTSPSGGGPKRGRGVWLWPVVLGVCLGLMHASKETCIIAWAAGAAGLLATAGDLLRIGTKRLAIAGLVGLVTAAAVSVLFFSSFGKNPHGIIDSLTAFAGYMGRAGGEGSAGEHVHPWYYYFQLLFWWRPEGAPLWSEAPIALLAMVGLVAGILGKGIGPSADDSHRPPRVSVVRMIAVYTVAITLVYVSIPYKTPWCALGFLHGLILLAGVGGAVLMRIAPGHLLKAAVGCLVIAAAMPLARQAYRASFADYEQPHNPYVYSHTTNDIYPFMERIRAIARAHPDGCQMHIQVICPNDDFWPLPWYLRDFPNVGYFSGEPRAADGRPLRAAPLIITQPKMHDLVVTYNYYRQPPGFRNLIVELPGKENGQRWQFRPFVAITAFVRRDLWLDYQAQDTGNGSTKDERSRGSMPQPF